MTTYRIDPYQTGSGPKQNQYGGPVWYKDPEKADLDIDVERVVLDIVRNTKALRDIDITEILMDGEIFQSMEDVSTITLSLHDPELRLLRSGVFSRSIDVRIDNMWWRLVSVTKNDDYLDLVFEDRILAYLKGKKEVKRASRGKMTRLEFCYSLTKTVRTKKIRVVIPELMKKFSIAATDEEKAEVKDRTTGGLNNDDTPDKTVSRGPQGLPGPGQKVTIKGKTGITVKGKKANSTQIRVLEEVLRVGGDMEVSKKFLLAALMVVIQESLAGMLNVSVSGRHVGPFHQEKGNTIWARRGGALPGNGTKAVRGGAKAFFLGAQSVDREFYTAEQLAEKVQVAGTPSAWGQHRQEAEKILKLFAGDEIDENQPRRTYRKRYVFSTEDGGKAQNYWTAIKRLLDEVNIACFTSNGILYMISENQLLKSKKKMIFSLDTPGVDDVDFTWDTDQRLATATVYCRITRWAAPPGTVVQLKDLPPASDNGGRWLVESIRRGLYSRDAEIVLKKPEPKLPEPAPEVAERADFNRSDGDASVGASGEPAATRGSLSYPLGEIGKNLGGVAAHMARAWGNWQSDNAVDIGVPIGTEVFAVDSGQIVKLGGAWRGGSGNPDGFNVTLHTKTNDWFYTHLKSRRSSLKVGDWVREGEFLGRSGAANGVKHLHIASRKGDPERLLRG